MITVNDTGAAISGLFDTATESGVQQVKPKIITEWRNARTADNLSVTVVPDYTDAEKLDGQVGSFFDVRQVANGWIRQAVSWAVSDAKDVDGLTIRADGTWHAMPEENNGDYEFGWRSKAKSDSAGDFGTDPVITMTFDEEKINYIDIYTAESSGAIKQYTLEYRDTSNAYQSVVANQVLVKGTSTYRHTLNSGNTIDITGIRLTIHKTQNGTDYARIHEINPIYETDITDRIIGFRVEKNREIHETTLPLGGISANTFNFQLDNTDQTYTLGRNHFGKYMARDVKFTVSLGWRISEDPDVFEYINCGTYWADEWRNSSDMTVNVTCRDYTRFMMDKDFESGFVVENSDAASAIRTIVTMNNFPKADFQALYPYQKAVLEDGAVAHYRFNEGASAGAAAATGTVTPTNGLLARWWNLSDLRSYTGDMQRARFASAVNQTIFGLGAKELFDYAQGAAVTENSTTNSASGYAVNYTEGTDMPSGLQDSYVHTAIDGFFIPPSTGLYKFKATVLNGGVRLYVGGSASRYIYESSYVHAANRRDTDLYKGELRINEFWNHASATGHVTDSIVLYANRPVPIRLEAFHVAGSFSLKLERNIGGGSYAAVAPSETATDIAFDVVGGRDDYVSANNFSSVNRNHGIYTGDPVLRKDNGITSDPKDYSVQFDSTSDPKDYMTVAYDASIDFTNTSGNNYNGGVFSMEAMVKFDAFVAGQGVYAGNLDNATSGTGTKGVGFFFKSSGHGVKFINNSGTMSEASVNTAGSTGEWIHVVATYDGTDLKYYYNGALAATAASVGSSASWLNSDYVIGKSVYGSGSSNAYLRGYMDEFVLYRKVLTAEQVRDHYYSTLISEIRIHPWLYGENNAFETSGAIATGDLGMFYFDEFGKFRYDHFNRLHEPGIPEHTVSQATLSDSVNIISAERRLELLANKIVIDVSPVTSADIGETSLWRAPANSSLGVTRLAAAVSSTELSTIETTNLHTPEWFRDGGYMKIDDEIIKYGSTDGEKFKDLTRGMFGTTAVAHALADSDDGNRNRKIREVAYFIFDWSQAPAVEIKTPHVSAIVNEKPDLIAIDRFKKGPYGGELVLSGTKDMKIEGGIGEVVFIEGVHAGTDLVWYTSIAGRALIRKSTGEIVSKSASYSESIRKYGVKELKITNQFYTDANYAQRLADFLISKMENGSPILDIDAVSQPRLQLGDRITISSLDQLGISNKDYWVIESKIDYTGGIAQTLTLREVA